MWGNSKPIHVFTIDSVSGCIQMGKNGTIVPTPPNVVPEKPKDSEQCLINYLRNEIETLREQNRKFKNELDVLVGNQETIDKQVVEIRAKDCRIANLEFGNMVLGIENNELGKILVKSGLFKKYERPDIIGKENF